MIEGTLTKAGAKGLGGEMPGQVFYGIQGPPGPQGPVGPRGPAGKNGIDGARGEPGITPVVSVANGFTEDGRGKVTVRITTESADGSAVTQEATVEDGRDGKDYVLTPEDKNEIADLAAGLVEIPEPNVAGFVAQDTEPEDTSVLWVDTNDESGEVPEGSGIAITGATVGQTVKISAVDENGVPTAWESVDFPSSGSGGLSEKWELINEGTITEEVQGISISEDMNGEPLQLSKCYLYCEIQPCATVATGAQYIHTRLNDWYDHGNANSPGDNVRYYQSIGAFVGGSYIVGHSVSTAPYNNGWAFANHTPAQKGWNDGATINKVSLIFGGGNPNPYVGVNSKYKLYGVRV